MGVETAAELAGMFDPAEFGTTATLWPGESRQRDVAVIYDAPWFGAGTEAEVDVSTAQPSILGPEADFAGLAHDDPVRVNGTAWRVYDLKPDGTGVMRVILGQ